MTTATLSRPVKSALLGVQNLSILVGRTFAVADLEYVRFAGFTAWLLWLGIHIYFLIGFANRLLVTLEWAISFVTKRRGVRILPLAQAEMTHADPDRQTVRS